LISIRVVELFLHMRFVIKTKRRCNLINNSLHY
jgi:hypothetical protein